MKGIVVKSTGSWYEVQTEEGNRIQARLKGKFRIKGLKSTNPVAVGDYVFFELEGEDAVIYKIQERKNYIIRKSINLSKQVQIIAANVDQLFLVITLNSPKTFMGFVDRFLVGAEAYRIPVVLLYNKMDLIVTDEEKSELQNWKNVYDLAGYQQFEISVQEQKGLDQVQDLMKNKDGKIISKKQYKRGRELYKMMKKEGRLAEPFKAKETKSKKRSKKSKSRSRSRSRR